MSECVGTDGDAEDVSKIANEDEEGEGSTSEGGGQGREDDEDGCGVEESDSNRHDDWAVASLRLARCREVRGTRDVQSDLGSLGGAGVDERHETQSDGDQDCQCASVSHSLNQRTTGLTPCDDVVGLVDLESSDRASCEHGEGSDDERDGEEVNSGPERSCQSGLIESEGDEDVLDGTGSLDGLEVDGPVLSSSILIDATTRDETHQK